MKITVIGIGNVGGALAKRWAAAGHEIVLGVRNAASDDLKALIQSPGKWVLKDVKSSIEGTDAIVIAIPAHLTAELATSLGDLKGRVVIDTTNSVFRKPEPYRTGFEAFQKITGAEVAKCFNSTGAENMADPFYPNAFGGTEPIAIDMFAAGSSAKAKAIALQLSQDAGFVTHDFGGDDKVELLEELCRIWINLAMGQGMGRGFAFKILAR
jgi:8-hydroxy-5-deazaflavin:NADPH oxidoreductase